MRNADVDNRSASIEVWYNKPMKNHSLNFRVALVAFGTLLLVAGVAQAQLWTPPPADFPAGNVNVPLTAGSSTQWKNGRLYVNELFLSPTSTGSGAAVFPINRGIVGASGANSRTVFYPYTGTNWGLYVASYRTGGGVITFQSGDSTTDQRTSSMIQMRPGVITTRGTFVLPNITTSTATTTAGALIYSGGTAYLYNGTSWNPVGSGSGGGGGWVADPSSQGIIYTDATNPNVKISTALKNATLSLDGTLNVNKVSASWSTGWYYEAGPTQNTGVNAGTSVTIDDYKAAYPSEFGSYAALTDIPRVNSAGANTDIADACRDLNPTASVFINTTECDGGPYSAVQGAASRPVLYDLRVWTDNGSYIVGYKRFNLKQDTVGSIGGVVNAAKLNLSERVLVATTTETIAGVSNLVVNVQGAVNASKYYMNGLPFTGGGSGGGFWASTTVPGTIFYNGGNVGIGTNTPGYALDVKGDIQIIGSLATSSVFRMGTASAELGQWIQRYDTVGDRYYMGFSGDQGGAIQLYANGTQNGPTVQFNPTGTDFFTPINNTVFIGNGKVGIGGPSEKEKLEVIGGNLTVRTDPSGRNGYPYKLTSDAFLGGGVPSGFQNCQCDVNTSIGDCPQTPDVLYYSPLDKGQFCYDQTTAFDVSTGRTTAGVYEYQRLLDTVQAETGNGFFNAGIMLGGYQFAGNTPSILFEPTEATRYTMRDRAGTMEFLNSGSAVKLSVGQDGAIRHKFDSSAPFQYGILSTLSGTNVDTAKAIAVNNASGVDKFVVYGNGDVNMTGSKITLGTGFSIDGLNLYRNAFRYNASSYSPPGSYCTAGVVDQGYGTDPVGFLGNASSNQCRTISGQIYLSAGSHSWAYGGGDDNAFVTFNGSNWVADGWNCSAGGGGSGSFSVAAGWYDISALVANCSGASGINFTIDGHNLSWYATNGKARQVVL